MKHLNINGGGGGQYLCNNENYILTTKKLPTRRGVMWLGQTCNLNCYFCYFAERIANKNHPEHPFFSLDKAKEICRIFVYEFNCNSIDIQGGEPTIYPHIFDLLKYCNQIGLKPSLITNLISLAKFDHAAKFKEAGIYDFLCSLHGIGSTYDKIVGRKGGFEKQIKALDNLSSLEIPIRANCVLTNEVIDELSQVTDLCIKYKARVVNFLGYNNAGDQKRLRDTCNIPYYDIIGQKLTPCIDRLESHGIEVNLRFLPFCVVEERHRKNIANSLQMIYDLHEWERSSRIWIERPAQRVAKMTTEQPLVQRFFTRYKWRIARKQKSLDFLYRTIAPYIHFDAKYAQIQPYQQKILDKFRFYTPNTENIESLSKLEHFYLEQHQLAHDHSKEKVKPKRCQSCQIKFICDGFHCDFIEEFGQSAIKPIRLNEEVKDPKYYSKLQYKIVEKQEWDWFFNDSERIKVGEAVREFLARSNDETTTG